jgi:hypothetical protein
MAPPMCNLCELTMGMALHPGMPSHLRWIRGNAGRAI